MVYSAINRRGFLKKFASSAVLGVGASSGYLSVSLPADLPSVEPTYIFHNGKILTVDKSFSTAQAIAVLDEKILAVGSNADVLRMAGNKTKKIDLEGRVLIPGFGDAHNHMLLFGLSNLKLGYGSVYIGEGRLLDLSSANSIEDVQRLVAERAKQLKPGEWVLTNNRFSFNRAKEKRPLTRWDLDIPAPNNPVIVFGGGTTLTANSYALKLGKIGKGTPDPWSGKIFLDPKTGEPNGLLEFSAMHILLDLLPEVPREKRIEALRFANKEYNRVGITSLRTGGDTIEEIKAYQDFHQMGELTVRVNLTFNYGGGVIKYIKYPEILDIVKNWSLRTGMGDNMLKLGSSMRSIDGGGDGAYVTEPHKFSERVPPGEKFYGYLLLPKEQLREIVQAFNNNDWQVSLQLRGDKALDVALDIYEEVNKEKSIVGRRWMVDDAMIPRADQFERINRLGVVVNSGDHTIAGTDSLSLYWGEEKARYAHPYRAWIDNGVMITGCTDADTMLPHNPLVALHYQVTRKQLNGKVVGEEQKLTREEALRVRTYNVAYATHEENIKGSLEPGKLADLVVLSGDLMTVPEDEIPKLKVLMTMVSGKVVFKHEEFKAPNLSVAASSQSDIRDCTFATLVTDCNSFICG